jgi:hypothetical protein
MGSWPLDRSVLSTSASPRRSCFKPTKMIFTPGQCNRTSGSQRYCTFSYEARLTREKHSRKTSVFG